MIYKNDLELIESARDVIDKNYDGVNYNHTVGAAIGADKLQPSQFYINEDKLFLLEKEFNIDIFEPIPIQKLGEDMVMTDGHTRTAYLIQNGYEYIPTIEENGTLDWEAYNINVNDCKKPNKQ